MKSFWRKCVKCGETMPYLTYFLGKDQNGKLTKGEKELCYECFKKQNKE